MNSNSNVLNGAITMTGKSLGFSLINRLFGTLFLAIGIINMFWGNDPGYGVFIALLSMVYFLPANEIFRKITGFSIPKMEVMKVLLGMFIMWTALGVGELFDKVGLMMADLRS